jgi:hydrogenase nickel incorporation protein HypA/HybF
MHEFSLATEVVSLVSREAEKNRAQSVEELTIEVGSLSGVEADAFSSALELLVPETILAKAKINIIRKKGTGRCIACDLEFEMDQRMTTCPRCSSFPSEIRGGEVLRVVSFTVC